MAPEGERKRKANERTMKPVSQLSGVSSGSLHSFGASEAIMQKFRYDDSESARGKKKKMVKFYFLYSC